MHPYRHHRLGGIRGARLCGDHLLRRKGQWVACWGAVGSGGPEPAVAEELLDHRRLLDDPHGASAAQASGSTS